LSTRVAVVGAGKIGLPIACHIADRGAVVVACDADQGTVDAVNAGRVPFDEPGLDQYVSRLASSGGLSASVNTAESVSSCDVVIVLVPVGITERQEADLSKMESALRDVSNGLREGTLVSIETTVPVGTSRQLARLLESSGLTAGEGFYFAYSPERIKSRRILEKLPVTPKIVAGLDEPSGARAADFYREFIGAPIIRVGSLEIAEMAKLAGMIYRDVNIALANEIAAYSEQSGVDIWEVIEAANTDGESALLMPGIGVGGHCTPVYPHFVISDAARRGVPVDLTATGRTVNELQPRRLVSRLLAELDTVGHPRVLIMGLAFRPLVKEHSNSPTFAVRDHLAAAGAEVFVHDPLYEPDELRALGFQPGDLESTDQIDALVLVTAHGVPEYTLDFRALAGRGLKAIVDGRHYWDPGTARAAGIVYIGVGQP